MIPRLDEDVELLEDCPAAVGVFSRGELRRVEALLYLSVYQPISLSVYLSVYVSILGR